MSGISDLDLKGRTDYDASMKVKFLTSAKEVKGYPPPLMPEIAVVGRSNAGKSSFINALTGQRIAKVSGTPGKTRLLNFFELEEKLYMVDMPGYGFATGDRQEVLGWLQMVETYFRERKTLKGVLLIMDIRREWAEEEQMLKGWLDHQKIPFAIVLNKSDKLSRSPALNRRQEILKSTGDIPVVITSAAKKTGLIEIKSLLFKTWI
jgi:GTP-binding protein